MQIFSFSGPENWVHVTWDSSIYDNDFANFDFRPGRPSLFSVFYPRVTSTTFDGGKTVIELF